MRDQTVPPEAYEAAVAGYDRAVNALLGAPPATPWTGVLRSVPPRWRRGDRALIAAAVDAVWPLAVAESRRQTAREIVAAQDATPDDISVAYYTAQAIAEGDDGG